MGPVRAFRSRHIWAAVAVLAVVSGCSSAAPGDPVTSSTGSVQQTTNTSTKTSAASKSVTATALDPSSTWLLVMGTHLEVVRDDGSDRHVAVPSVDTAGRAGDIGLADWSPDGSQIAFTEIIRASQATDQPRANLWVADSDGSNARKVFECGSACTVRAAPTWSPDGKRLAFAWGRYDEDRRVWASGGVAVGDLASGRAHVVFESALPSDGVDLVRWSGDGRQLLLSMVESSNNGPDGVPVASRVAVINTAGPPSQRPRPLTPDAIEAGMADWDPRSGRIVYATKILEQRGQAPPGTRTSSPWPRTAQTCDAQRTSRGRPAGPPSRSGRRTAASSSPTAWRPASASSATSTRTARTSNCRRRSPARRHRSSRRAETQPP